LRLWTLLRAVISAEFGPCARVTSGSKSANEARAVKNWVVRIFAGAMECLWVLVRRYE
jgi:hypothetical protein